MAGVNGRLIPNDIGRPRGIAKTEEAPPEGTMKSRAYIPTTGPCYENPVDLRFPLHWSKILFNDRGFYEPYSDEIRTAQRAVRQELKPLGVVVRFSAFSEVVHIPGTRCPFFFHVKIRDGTRWDIWKDIQGTVFKTITKHCAHLEGFTRPVLRWNVLSDNPIPQDITFGLLDDLPHPERPSTRPAANTRTVVETEAYVPTTGPPYETPLDLRFPLHWDNTARNKWVNSEGSPHRELPPGRAAEEAACDDLWNYVLYPGRIKLRRCIAEGIEHYPEGISEPYFQIHIDTPDAWSKEIHEFVVMTIEKYFGKLEGYIHEKPIIRYVVSAQSPHDSDTVSGEDDMWDGVLD